MGRSHEYAELPLHSTTNSTLPLKTLLCTLSVMLSLQGYKLNGVGSLQCLEKYIDN